MSIDRRIWLEEPHPELGWTLVVCEFCDRAFGPIESYGEARAWAQRHARQHPQGNTGLYPSVVDEHDLACIEDGCWRRRHYADGRCRACWIAHKRAVQARVRFEDGAAA